MANDENMILSDCVPLLLSWYRANRRMLPWRAEPTPYHVWISEIMLQQTRIEAVIPYYHRFLQELPSVEALAAVPEERLLKLWEGLGYYSRARNLKKAAERLLADFGGVLPRHASELRKLPGIGDYTAGAIASIAYGEAEPAVDGNVLRVIMRLTACADDVLAQKTRQRVASELRLVYPQGQDAGLLTEGLMELGETVCLPNGAPRCADCPLRWLCRAHAAGTEELYPVRAAKKERRRQERTILLLRCDGRFALRRRESQGLLAGMWEFPGLDGFVDEKAAAAYLKSLEMLPLSLKSCGRAKHIFTHVEWHMQGYMIDCDRQSPAFFWKTPEEIRRDCALPTAFKAYADLIG